jgi:lycopene cyclase domain-containing protein
MNLSYLMLNLLFTWFAWALLRRNVRALAWRAVLLSLALVLLLTAVFDNLIVGLGIVEYDPIRILGARIGIAPIEDFGYAIVGAFGVPALWNRLHKIGKPASAE